MLRVGPHICCCSQSTRDIILVCIELGSSARHMHMYVFAWPACMHTACRHTCDASKHLWCTCTVQHSRLNHTTVFNDTYHSGPKKDRPQKAWLLLQHQPSKNNRPLPCHRCCLRQRQPGPQADLGTLRCHQCLLAESRSSASKSIRSTQFEASKAAGRSAQL